MAMQESGEMYLETIHVLSRTNPTVRAIDVSEHMGYSKPSVSRAMGILKESGMITVDADGAIRLTDAGRERAEQIYERHTVFTRIFKAIGVDDQTAEDDACRIEHYISDTTFEAIKNYLKEHGQD
ncbi:MAG: metal-dependent transcriptional regulator [Lachnospiraceae bacterium]|nr:metal-dependent transcriptional regulator [Lachnospiraceae bacterium]